MSNKTQEIFTREALYNELPGKKWYPDAVFLKNAGVLVEVVVNRRPEEKVMGERAEISALVLTLEKVAKRAFGLNEYPDFDENLYSAAVYFFQNGLTMRLVDTGVEPTTNNFQELTDALIAAAMGQPDNGNDEEVA